MDNSALLALQLAVNFDIHGVPATITRPAPDETPIVTTGVWTEPLAENQPFGTDIRRFDPRLVFMVRTSAVPDAKKGTLIEAPPRGGGAVQTWIVDGYELKTAERLRLIVKPTTS